MFTGIIEATAKVLDSTKEGITVTRPESFTDLAIGASIAVSGVCLSIISFDEKSITFDVVPETKDRSTLETIQNGDTVNLERSVRANQRIDGHTVQGHVEGRGRVVALSPGGGGTLQIELPKDLIKFCVQKGSIAVDGVSLTIAEISGNTVTVALVPHTLKNTTLGSKQTGDFVNIETDIIGRYLYAFAHEKTAHQR